MKNFIAHLAIFLLLGAAFNIATAWGCAAWVTSSSDQYTEVPFDSVQMYLAGLKAGERRTQKVVAETTGITEATLRSRTKDLIKNLSLKVQIR